MSSATPRAVPLHCPYGGETDLRPGGETDGEWHCRICARTFRLTFLGLGSEETHFATEETP